MNCFNSFQLLECMTLQALQRLKNLTELLPGHLPLQPQMKMATPQNLLASKPRPSETEYWQGNSVLPRLESKAYRKERFIPGSRVTVIRSGSTNFISEEFNC